MTHILFISVQGHGHVYPSLGVVRELVSRGHRVTYVTTELFADTVRAAGAEAVHYRSEFETFHVPDAVGREDAEALLHMVYVKENEAILRAAEAALEHDRPDLVAYDVFPFIAGRLLTLRWAVPGVRLSPIFAANGHYSIFEALWRGNGFGHPADVPAVRAEMTGLLAGYGVHRGIREFWDEIDDLNIVFIPRSFQIAAETFDDRFHFVGPTPAPELPTSWTPPPPGTPLLLISLGNQFNNHPGFFRTCAAALAGTGWHAVLAIGTFLDLAALGELPPNVEAHRWIPFGAVLEHATVCVTQGTTGAVMEALTHGVPMVLVPQYATEAKPSAERVAELGLGRLLTEEEVTPDGIRAAVEQVATNPEIRRRALGAQRDIAEAGGPARAATAIEDHLRVRTAAAPRAAES